MAKLSNINGKFAVEDTGAIRFSDQTGTTGQILKSNGNSAPTWVDPNTVGTGPWLPLAGGIVSGPTTFQSSLTVVGNIRTGTSTLTANTNFDNLVIEGSASSGITIFSGTSNNGGIYFGDSGANNLGQIKYLHGSNSMTFATNDSAASLTLDSGLDAIFAGTVDGQGFRTTSGSTDYSLLTRNSTNTAVYIQQAGTGNIVDFRYGSQAAGQGTSAMIIKDTGEVAIGANFTGYDGQILAIDCGTADTVLYGQSSDANCFASFRDNSSTLNIEYGAIGNAHVFRKDTAEYMRIDGSGNVGIGTDNPDNKLDIALTTAAISFDTAIKVSANTNPVDYTSNRGAGILFQNAEPYVAGIYGIRPSLGGWRGHLLFYTHTSASNNTFDTTFTEKMRITDEGNVGIGTNSPTQAKLCIDGTQNSIYLTRGGASDTKWTISSDSVSMYIGETVAGNIMTLREDGHVGINTTGPLHPLHVEGANTSGIVDVASFVNPVNAAGTGHGARIIMHSTTDTRRGVAIASYSDANYAVDNSMVFYTSVASTLTERMRIESGGNVRVSFNQSSSNGNLYFQDVDNGASMFYIQPAVYKGTAPYNTNYINAANSTSIGFITGGSERLTIDNNGAISMAATYNNTTASAANMHISSAGGQIFRSTSSLKYKTDVRDYDKGLNEVMQLQPKYYKGKDDGDTQFAGLIAEDVHDLGLTEFVQYAEDGTPDALAYTHMVALLVKSIQELEARIKILENK